MTYEQARAEQNRLESVLRAVGVELKALGAGTGPMGLTPDSVKASYAYTETKARSAMAFRRLQAFNKWLVKTYPEARKSSRV